MPKKKSTKKSSTAKKTVKKEKPALTVKEKSPVTLEPEQIPVFEIVEECEQEERVDHVEIVTKTKNGPVIEELDVVFCEPEPPIEYSARDIVLTGDEVKSFENVKDDILIALSKSMGSMGAARSAIEATITKDQITDHSVISYLLELHREERKRREHRLERDLERPPNQGKTLKEVAVEFAIEQQQQQQQQPPAKSDFTIDGRPVNPTNDISAFKKRPEDL